MSELIYRIETTKDIYKTRNALEETLKQRQFGILSEIDVAAVMRKKGVTFDDELLLLGVCNPGYAKKALGFDSDVAVMLPCSIVVQKEGEGSTIKLARPTYLVNLFANKSLVELGREVESLLIEAINEAASDE